MGDIILDRDAASDLLHMITGGEGITVMTLLEWRDRDAVDIALWAFSDGASAREVADLVGYGVSTVVRWREKAGL